jgi:hypothetical protein
LGQLGLVLLAENSLGRKGLSLRKKWLNGTPTKLLEKQLPWGKWKKFNPQATLLSQQFRTLQIPFSMGNL